MLLEAPQIWRMKRYNVLETELVYTPTPLWNCLLTIFWSREKKKNVCPPPPSRLSETFFRTAAKFLTSRSSSAIFLPPPTPPSKHPGAAPASADGDVSETCWRLEMFKKKKKKKKKSEIEHENGLRSHQGNVSETSHRRPRTKWQPICPEVAGDVSVTTLAVAATIFEMSSQPCGNVSATSPAVAATSPQHLRQSWRCLRDVFGSLLALQQVSEMSPQSRAK